MNSASRPEQQGFTLVEVMIALLIGGVVMAAVMTTFRVQHNTYLAQDQVVEMQQNLRVAMDMLSREIRSAGFDPTGESGAGIVDADENQLRFTRDLDASGGTYISPTDTFENDPSERISYQLNVNPPSLGRTTGNGVVPQPVADNIVALEFLYLLADGTTVLNPDPADFGNIRGVTISMLARAANEDRSHTDNLRYFPASNPTMDEDEFFWGPFDDGFRRRLLIQTVMFRNLGL
ncbi:prepilin-type N-terminal cleavage/methylation domain-containing protein [Desulfurivibrio sp. D14AmB]|uniref:prepilin-type N-terminal cleavage/methylation domain-containing protein n=1 Tax=Desulfurivibrio sp. D14AmB TaxID=3374370 RepID=UPI00376EDB86